MDENNKIQSNDIDVKAIILFVLHKWYVFVIAVALCCCGTTIYYFAAAPQYSTSASILIRSDEGSNPLNNIVVGGFAASDFLGGSSRSIDNEIEIMNSRQLLMQLIDELGLRIKVQRKIGWRKIDQFGHEPMRVTLPDDFLQQPGNLSIRIKKDKEANYSYKFVRNCLGNKTKFTCESKSLTNIETPWGTFSFTEVPENLTIPGKEDDPTYTIYFTINSLKSETDELSKKLSIVAANKKANAINISYQSDNPRKSEAIVTTLIDLYNRGELDDKNKVQSEMVRFVSERLVTITSDLNAVENDMEEYKKSHNIADISKQAQVFIETSSEYEKRIAEADIQYSLISFIENYLRKATDSDLIPNNTGVEDESLSTLMNSYNELVLKYLRISKTTNETNPIIEQTLSEIRLMRSNILQTITNVKQSIVITKRDLTAKSQEFSKQIGDVPTMEREYVNLEREREIQQTLYVTLLQKRELSQMQLASTTEAARTIDPAYTSERPVAPKLSLLLLIGGVLGCALAAVYLYFLALFGKKGSCDEIIKN